MNQVVGEHSRANDLVVNITKTKKLTNMRSSGADDKVKNSSSYTIYVRRGFRIYSSR